MGSNFDKTILILDGDKTKSSLAIKALAMDLDTKFDELGHKTIREVPAFVCRESHATCLKYTVLYDASCIISPV